jgi:hypothetical protein
MSPDRHARTLLLTPDRPSLGLTTYDAKDPATSYPRSSPCSRLRVHRTR